jgi:hypothetical protein
MKQHFFNDKRGNRIVFDLHYISLNLKKLFGVALTESLIFYHVVEEELRQAINLSLSGPRTHLLQVQPTHPPHQRLVANCVLLD